MAPLRRSSESQARRGRGLKVGEGGLGSRYRRTKAPPFLEQANYCIWRSGEYMMVDCGAAGGATVCYGEEKGPSRCLTKKRVLDPSTSQALLKVALDRQVYIGYNRPPYFLRRNA